MHVCGFLMTKIICDDSGCLSKEGEGGEEGEMDGLIGSDVAFWFFISWGIRCSSFWVGCKMQVCGGSIMIVIS